VTDALPSKAGTVLNVQLMAFVTAVSLPPPASHIVPKPEPVPVALAMAVHAELPELLVARRRYS